MAHPMTMQDKDSIAPIMGISRHRLSTDGRGITTLVGLHGCPLDCRYCLNDKCHTPDGIWKHMSPQELYDEVAKDDIYYRSTGGGITFGGGEPALHSQYIEQFAQLNKNKWNITLETSLNVPTRHIERLVHVIDDYIIDIKSLNSTIYTLYTGKGTDAVVNNLHYLISCGKSAHITIRTPLIPGYNTEKDVSESVEKLRAMGLQHFDTFTYHIDPARHHSHAGNGKRGKSTCNVLKRIRSIIADANHIAYEPTACPHSLCTTGNCPKCEQELAWLTQQIYDMKNPLL